MSTREFTAVIAPLCDTVGHTGSTYSLTVTNAPSSDTTLGWVNTSVPSDYSNVVLGSPTASAGKRWTASLVSGTIQLRANSSADALDPGQHLLMELTATAPLQERVYEWTTRGKQAAQSTDSGFLFALLGPQPSVEVANLCGHLSIASILDESGGLPFVVKNQSFAVVVEVMDQNDNPFPVEEDTQISLTTTGGAGTLLGDTTQTILAGGTEVTFTGLTYDQVENVTLCASGGRLGPGCRLLSVQNLARTFQETAGGFTVQTCADATPENPKCVTAEFHRGVGSAGFLSQGSCLNFPGVEKMCPTADSLVSLIGDLTDPLTGEDLYTRTDPLTVSQECDKTVCKQKSQPASGIPRFTLSVQVVDGGPFVDSPSCPARGTVGDDQKFCTDYRASHRDGSGDLVLVLLLTTDPRWY